MKSKALKKGERGDLDFLEFVREKIAAGEKIERESVSARNIELFDRLQLLSSKPVIYVLNSAEDEAGNTCDEVVASLGEDRAIAISARI